MLVLERSGWSSPARPPDFGGFQGDDIAWLPETAPGEPVIVRPTTRTH